MTRTSEGLWAIIGPTATGKTSLALALAERTPSLEVVNADASQFYRGMNIGTAKVTPAERERVPHHIIDILSVRDEANVADYQGRARTAISEIATRGNQPVLVGGSGLYVRIAVDEIDIPPTDAHVRERITEWVEQVGTPAAYARLRELDRAAADAIEPKNERRIIRALEVIELVGSFSATMPTRTFVRPTVMVGLRVDRALLYQRIEHRARAMFAAGLIEEVEGLIPHGLREGATASRAIGYAQALAVIDGQCTREQAIESTSAATRRLARRQEAWFRPDPRIVWLDADAPDLVDQAEAAYARMNA